MVTVSPGKKKQTNQKTNKTKQTYVIGAVAWRESVFFPLVVIELSFH